MTEYIGRTYDHFLVVDAFPYRVRPGDDKHISNALAGSFLAKRHLQDG
jgi:hypothetical protein